MIGMRRLLLCAAALAAAIPAAASIPPVGWKGPRWTGPGDLCRPSFTLRLEAGERAEQQYPSVGLIRFVVTSDAGAFTVAEDWMSGRTYEERELVRRTDEGMIFRLTGRNDGRTYLFLPEDGELPFQLRFDPLAGQATSFAGEAEQKVLSRLAFARPVRKNCLVEEKPA